MSKIGIFLPGQHGDIMSAMSVLKYKDMLWSGKEIVWFCGETPMKDVLNHNDAITEIRNWPHGWELPERCKIETPKALSLGLPAWEDFSILKTADNKLHPQLKHNFSSTSDLEQGYFPAPWMMPPPQRDGIDYPNISRKVFKIDRSLEWHPYLGFSDEERQKVKDFCLTLPHSKTIMMETGSGSGQTNWNDDYTIKTIKICREKWGDCNFIFASHQDNSRFFDDIGMVSASHFTVRQAALINNYSDLFVGVSSGISVATSCWGNKPTPKIQVCNSFICSTVSMTLGSIDLIISDDYEPRLRSLIDRIS